MDNLVYESKKLRIKRAIENLYKVNNENADILRKRFESIIINNGDINELKELEEELSNYNDCFKFLSKIDYLHSVIDNVKNVNEIKEYVKLGLEILDIYSKIRKENGDIKFDKLYFTIYELIKKELLFMDSSKVFDVLCHDDIFCYHVSKYVEQDVENIKSSIDEMKFVSEIDSKVSELNTNGISSHYFDYNLINLIVKSTYYTEKNSYYNELISKMNDDVISNLNEIKKLEKIHYINEKNSIIEEAKERSKKHHENFEKRFLALSLSTLLFGGVAFSIPKVSKAVSYAKYYETTTEIYITGEEKNDPLVDYQLKKSREVSRMLEIGDMLSDDGKNRKIYTYDLTEIILDTIEDYANIDVDYYNLKKDWYWSNNDYIVEKLDNGNRRMTIITQDLNKCDLRLKKVQRIIIMLVSYLVVLGLACVEHISPVYQLICLLDALQTRKNNKEEFDKTLEDLIKALDEMHIYFNNIYNLKSKYDSLDEEYIEKFVSEEKSKKLKLSFKEYENLEDKFNEMRRGK